jgi:hypothetical protein
MTLAAVGILLNISENGEGGLLQAVQALQKSLQVELRRMEDLTSDEVIIAGGGTVATFIRCDCPGVPKARRSERSIFVEQQRPGTRIVLCEGASGWN